MRIAITTTAFPFHPGEQFLESEIGYWSGIKDIEVILLPSRSSGQARPVPEDINVLRGERTALHLKLFLALRTFIHPVFWKELRYLSKQKILSVKNILLAFKSTVSVLCEKNSIERRLEHLGVIDLAYSYWNSETAYALCLLKRSGRIRYVVSRAHRFDLYEHMRPTGYMPLKRQFVHDFNYIYAISEDARIYLCATYGFASEIVKVARLGVAVPPQPTSPGKVGVIRLLSISFCVPVKRIHKIIEAIRYLCSVSPDIFIEWTHIGDGPLKQSLEQTASSSLQSLQNVKFRFAGHLENSDVLNFLKNNPVDIFINSSASEGVPVSIMEAMAHGIPAIAPSVGGVPELVNEHTGVLLPVEMSPHDVYTAILSLTGEHAKAYRDQARAFVQARHSASTNYSDFTSKLLSVSRGG